MKLKLFKCLNYDVCGTMILTTTPYMPLLYRQLRTFVQSQSVCTPLCLLRALCACHVWMWNKLGQLLSLLLLLLFYQLLSRYRCLKVLQNIVSVQETIAYQTQLLKFCGGCPATITSSLTSSQTSTSQVTHRLSVLTPHYYPLTVLQLSQDSVFNPNAFSDFVNCCVFVTWPSSSPLHFDVEKYASLQLFQGTQHLCL